MKLLRGSFKCSSHEKLSADAVEAERGGGEEDEEEEGGGGGLDRMRKAKTGDALLMMPPLGLNSEPPRFGTPKRLHLHHLSMTSSISLDQRPVVVPRSVHLEESKGGFDLFI